MQVRATRKPPVRVSPEAAEAAVQEVMAEAAELNPAWVEAAAAAQSKQAVKLVALDLRGVTSMTDLFLICHGRNSRQNQAISDEIETHLKKELGERPTSVEGFTTAEWILMDYGDFVVHIFSEKARAYYDLERLYRGAKQLDVPGAENEEEAEVEAEAGLEA